MDQARADGEADSPVSENDTDKEESTPTETDAGLWKEQRFHALSEDFVATKRSHRIEPAKSAVSY